MTRPGKTIEQVLDEFLAEQQARWSPATYCKYETIVGLLKRYMESYWPGRAATAAGCCPPFSRKVTVTLMPGLAVGVPGERSF